MSKYRWQPIKDRNVVHKWECPNKKDCGNFTQVGPAWYQNNGTPMCTDCDEDMHYVDTEVRIKDEAK